MPLSPEADGSVTLRKVNESVYSLNPFPFAQDGLKITCRGRYAKPFPRDFDQSKVGAALRSLPMDMQSYELIAA